MRASQIGHLSIYRLARGLLRLVVAVVASVTFAFAVLALGRPVGVGLAFLLRHESCGLCGAGGGLLELGVAAQVEQCAALAVVDLEVEDVLGGEVGHGHGSLAGDGGRQGAQLSEVNLVALEDEFTDAATQFAEDAEDGALAEHAVVLADVGAELAEADYAGELDLAIGLLGVVFVGGVAQHTYGILNLFHGVL